MEMWRTRVGQSNCQRLGIAKCSYQATMWSVGNCSVVDVGAVDGEGGAVVGVDAGDAAAAAAAVASGLVVAGEAAWCPDAAVVAAGHTERIGDDIEQRRLLRRRLLLLLLLPLLLMVMWRRRRCWLLLRRLALNHIDTGRGCCCTGQWPG